MCIQLASSSRLKSLPAFQCFMDTVESLHYHIGLRGGNTPKAEKYNRTTDKLKR